MYFDIEENQLPIIYRKEYNVHFMGMEKLHPFDAKKWGHIFKLLKLSEFVDENTVTKPNEATTEYLLLAHPRKYINSLKCSFNVAKIAEIPPLMLVPNFFVQRGYLRPMRYQTGGSILAGKLALDKGWAINLGGGFHHCSARKGQGFCPYADISLLIKYLFEYKSDVVKKVMIVDLDAHQGNGHERDFINNKNVFILDIYNKDVYPHDYVAAAGISCRIPLYSYTEDKEYLTKVKFHLDKSLKLFKPDLVVYNAGTDILKGDRLGLLSISPEDVESESEVTQPNFLLHFEGVIRRDELVFQLVRSAHIPIAMLTSGGYLKQTARIIATSILNLYDKNLINKPICRV